MSIACGTEGVSKWQTLAFRGGILSRLPLNAAWLRLRRHSQKPPVHAPLEARLGRLAVLSPSPMRSTIAGASVLPHQWQHALPGLLTEFHNAPFPCLPKSVNSHAKRWSQAESQGADHAGPLSTGVHVIGRKELLHDFLRELSMDMSFIICPCDFLF